MSNPQSLSVQPTLTQPIYNPYTKQIFLPTRPQPPSLIQPSIPSSSSHPHDSRWFGQKIHPNVSSCRLLLQNPNGVDTNDKCLEYGSILTDMKHFKIDMLLLPESNINSHNFTIVDNLRAAASLHLNHGNVNITNTPHFPHSSYQPGGVLTTTCNTLASRLAATSSDPAGRWTCNSFYGKQSFLKVYCLYRVGPLTDMGVITAAAQQQNYFMTTTNTSLDPRKKVIDDLLQTLQQDISQGNEIILCGDFNEAIGSKDATHDRLEQIGLTNILTERIGDLPRTFIRGKACIDHFYTTSRVAEAITSVGIAPFNFFLPSDHRAIYIDLNLKDILDIDTNHFPPFLFRRLKSTSQSAVQSYIKSIAKGYKQLHIRSRLRRLTKSFKKQGATSLNIRALNQLDSDITKLMMSAESSCSKVHKNCKSPWSPTLKDAIKAYRRSKLIVKKIRKSSQSNPSHLESAIAARRHARSHYKAVLSQSATYREQFLLQQAEFVADCRGTNAYQEYSNLLRYEKLRNSFSKIKRCLRGSFSGSLSSILIPSREEYPDHLTSDPQFSHYDIDAMWDLIQPYNGKNITSWERISDGPKLEELLLLWMGKHNAQASESPLASPLWQTKLDHPQTRESILNGTFHDESLPPEVSEFLSSFALPSPAPAVPFTYDFERFCSYIKSTKEKIASSPSGRHLGHYKTLLMMKKKKLLHAIFDIMQLAMDHSLILDRFLGVALTLLEKETGSPKIHRLRPIALVETELNCIAKAHWAQDMMRSIEKNTLITDDQYGGRKGRQAQSAVLNKMLYFNIQHQLAESAVFIDKDARNCFDRFLPNLISLENELLGSPKQASTFMINILRNQKIHARTKFGVTSARISDLSHRPHFGSGQGIGWSGQACAASLNSVSRTMSKHTYGLVYTSPDRSTNVETAGDCFVDDTELGVNMSALPPRANLLHEASITDQKHTLYWFTTGGLNANDKGSWYFISFTFHNGVPVFNSISESPASLHTQPKFDSPPVLTPRLEYNQAHTTLGCTVAPNMDSSQQLAIVKKMASFWVHHVTTSFLSPTDKLRSFSSILVPQIGYRLALSCFSYDECDSIMKIITPTLLHASHFHRNFSRDLTYAPPQYGGLRFPHFFYLLLQYKAKLFTFHYRRQDKTGRLLKISIEHTQLQAGTSAPFYSLKYLTWRKILRPTWFTHLWSLLDLCSISLTITNPWTYIPPRSNDCFLMDILLPHIPSPSIHYALNACRLHLQILTLSDMTTLDGSIILPNLLHGQQFRSSSLKWPAQEIPTHWWSTWSMYIQSYVVPYLSLHRLGNWHSSTHQVWHWRQLSPDRIVSPSLQIYSSTSPSRLSLFHPTDSSFSSNTTSLPILDIIPETASFRILSSSPPISFHPPSPPPFDYSFLHRHERYHHRNHRRLKKYLQRGTALLATDGSAYVRDKASFSSIITSSKGQILYSNYGPVLGDSEYLASDRAELMAILALITKLPLLYDSLHIPFPSTRLHLYTDSEVALKLIKKTSFRNHFASTFTNNSDLLYEIHDLLRHSPLHYTFHHIKSHQDDTLPLDSLSLHARINVEADRIADLQYLQPISQHHQKMPHLPAQIISFSSIQHRLTNNTLEELIRLHRDSATETTLMDQWKLSPQLLQTIDWYGLKKTFLSQPPFSSSLSKTLHTQWDTQSRKKRWKQSPTALCPLCHSSPETPQHVLRCPHSTLSTARNDSIQSLLQKLRKIHTAPLIIRRIQYIIQRWTQQQRIRNFSSRPSHLHKLMRSALKSQKAIGIFHFLRGVISQQWTQVQQEYCKRNDLQFRSTWSTHLISALLKHTHLMWTSRCKLIHLSNIGTHEETIRQSAYQHLLTLRSDPTQINYRHRSLLRRNRQFFFSANLPTVQMWMTRTRSAVAYAKKKQQQLGTDIRNWILIRPRDPGRTPRGARIPRRSRLFRFPVRGSP